MLACISNPSETSKVKRFRDHTHLEKATKQGETAISTQSHPIPKMLHSHSTPHIHFTPQLYVILYSRACKTVRLVSPLAVSKLGFVNTTVSLLHYTLDQSTHSQMNQTTEYILSLLVTHLYT